MTHPMSISIPVADMQPETFSAYEMSMSGRLMDFPTNSIRNESMIDRRRPVKQKKPADIDKPEPEIKQEKISLWNKIKRKIGDFIYWVIGLVKKTKNKITGQKNVTPVDVNADEDVIDGMSQWKKGRDQRNIRGDVNMIGSPASRSLSAFKDQYMPSFPLPPTTNAYGRVYSWI